MKIENERIEKLAGIAQNVTGRVGSASFHAADKNTNSGVIYGKDLTMGTPVFDVEKNSVTDIQSEASLTNVRQTKDTMALLSNIMTEEDYEEFMRNGGNINDTEIDTIVTVVDKIQISLATYCDDYKGYTGDISKEVLQKMAGNTQLAYSIANALKEQDLPVTKENVTGVLEAVSMAENLEPVAESTALYLIQNKMEPTIENMYIAQHSTGNCMLGDYGREFFAKDTGNYYSKIGAGRDFNGMNQKMEEIITRAGLEVNEETMDAAKWILEHQLPLTEENLKLADQISEVSIPQETKKLIESIVSTIARGEKPIKAPLTTDDNFIRRSEEVVKTLEQTSTEDIKALVFGKEDITIENLSKEIESPSGRGANLRDGDARVIVAYRTVEELRLQMTLQASVRMMRNGIPVETTKLSNLVEELRSLEEEAYRTMMKGHKIEETQEKINLLSAIAIRGEALAFLPAAVVGNVLKENVIPTIDELYQRGNVMRNEYLHAKESYEALGTAPRRDLGDNIQKAFQNVDNLLNEIGAETTAENQRAARILGYNSMEISMKNINDVKVLDAKVQYLMRNLAPSVTLEMVRRQMNPLNKPIDEVNEEIARLREELNITRDDEYSKFLWKMEQSKDISPEEREAYVGIYRLLRQVEKSDGAVIGSILEQGNELTLQNLLTNVRTRKHHNVDYRVEDAFGVVESRTEAKNSISAQIEQGFSNGSEGESEQSKYQRYLAGQILDTISPEKLAQVMEDKGLMDKNLEEVLDAMTEANVDSELEGRYIKEELQRIAQYKQTEDRVISQLEALDIPMTFRNITSMEGILQGQGQLFRQLLNLDSEENEDVEQMFESAIEASGEEETLKEVYASLEKTAKKLTEHYVNEEEITSLDVRSMKTLYSQFHILGQMSRQEKYFVPLNTDEGWTGVNLTILHQNENQGKVQVSMETKKFGRVKAEFFVTRDRISGYVASNHADGLELLKSGDTRLLGDLSGIQENVQIDYLREDKLEWFKPEASQGERVHTTTLYGVAKSFLKNLSSLA